MRTAADPTLRAYAAHVPVGEAAAKLRRWREQDAEIHYPSSHRDPGDVAKEAAVLAKFAFPAGRIVASERGEIYGDVAAREMPGVLIEDDCESLDGASEMTHPQIAPERRAHIKSIIVSEFGGIDHLPDSIEALPTFES